jgi:predicted RecB family nuclease
MENMITRAVVESYPQCKYKAHLRLAGEQGIPTDYEFLMGEARRRVWQGATELLLARHKKHEVVLGPSLTPVLLGQGARLILDATLEREGLAVCFDALKRLDGQSSLGDFHYGPVLFHEAERPGREQRILLAMLGQILGSLQGKEPKWGVLIHGQNCEVRRIKLVILSHEARRTLQEIGEIQATGAPPRLFLNPHCQICDYRRRCHAEATARDDLSLLRGMGEKEITKYARRGLFTVTQLSYTYRPRKKHRTSNRKGQAHQHTLQALAIREKRVYILGTPELPVASTQVYFDVEGDPERRFDYLLGMTITANGVMEQHTFWADSPAEEPRLFQQFLDVIGRFDDFRLYCYGSYESTFLRRMIKRLERQDLSEKLMPRLVNALSIIHSHVYFPTYSNGLKEISKFLGFRWTEEDASGIQSIVWRRRWEETCSATFKDKLTTYNLEDCAALKRVTEFLHEVSSRESQPRNVSAEGIEIARVAEIACQSVRPDWGTTAFALPDFSFVNERAHFDYQRDKVLIRTSKKNTATMSVSHGVAGVDEPAKELPKSQRLFTYTLGRNTRRMKRPDGFLERLPANKPHGVVGPSVRVMPEVINRHDTRMLKSPRDFRFLHEAAAADGIVRMMLLNLLDGHFAVERLVQCDKDLAQPALGMRPQHQVAIAIGLWHIGPG